MRVTRIRVEDFRCIGRVDCEISPLTVLIGPNAAGKSSLLEAIRFFTPLHSGVSFSSALAPQGGFPANRRYQAAETSPIKLGVSVADEPRTFHYDVSLRGEGATGCFIESETLRRKLTHTDDVYSDETLLDRADTVIRLKGAHGTPVAHDSTSVVHRFTGEYREMERFLEALQRISLWKAHRFHPDGPIRRPQQLLSSANPQENGQELYSTLYTMRLERPQVYNELLEVIRLAVPEFERLEFPPAGGGMINLAWHQSDLVSPLYPPQLSDGIVRFLWLMTVLHSVPDDGLVLLDEPELSLHPQWLMLLVSVLRSMSARTTILVATQSVEFVRWCKPEELVVANLTDKRSELVRPRDRDDLDAWLKDFNLGELWTMGELGGRR
ncbi:MAG TPA: AAA family ATPase [Phycisphaerae bacterium]|nr:AAA family ATPase [Phycisphaerae bacterium]